ncbi:hypothetical protein [Rasiella sp. SM2506]|uniref:hypothetical protein n=1 Tax=Rasiella sp. SM2506 TaxID=3423914 RepID=UPI003D78C2F0
MELNRLQVFENEITRGNREYFLGFMSNYFLKYPTKTTNTSLNKLLWKGIETTEQPKNLMAYLDQESYTIGRYLELSEDVLLQTEVVLELLDDIEK